MKRLSFVLCLLSLSAFADITIVAPKDGATVSLLKAEQRAYLAQPKDARWARMADAAARAKYAKCGGRPASVTLEWTDAEPGEKKMYAVGLKCIETGKSDRFDVTGTKAELVNLETGRTYEWKVGEVTATFKTADEKRLMLFPGVANCRDLGGKHVRQGRVYRTAAYNGSSKRVGDSFLDAKFVSGPMRITKAGRREMVETCGIRTDLDLRNEAECAGMKLSPLGKDVKWVHIPIRAYAWLENDKAAMGKILKLFADEKNYPIAFHCSGGRDRAGSLAFVLEGLCGVSEDELMKDWEFSIFDTDDVGFAPTRIEGLVEMLSRYPGDNINERIESFANACGLKDEDIAKIRANLMER